MKKNLTIKDFTPREIDGVEVVTWSELEMKMGKKGFRNFQRWMCGQTCTANGVYPWDLERYLQGKPVID